MNTGDQHGNNMRIEIEVFSPNYIPTQWPLGGEEIEMVAHYYTITNYGMDYTVH